jgi:hypothetical protein
LLLVLGMLDGIALTWGAAWVGFTLATMPTCRRPKWSTARLRVKAASDASAAYMMENSSNCPRGIGELISKKYLDPANAKDPWGTDLIFHCPGTCASPRADVSSAGPDQKEGTPDDIKSWELYP